MAKMREWDIYEAAVLLDAYLKVRSGGLTKKKAIEQVSCALRKMATNNGSVIDDIYRNENGISFQFQRMDSAFSGKTIIIPSTKLFDEVVNLYTNSRDRFDAILSDAFSMIKTQKTNADAFREWISKNYPKQRWESIIKDLQTAEEYCRKKLILKTSLLETTDPVIVKRVFTAVESDKVFRFTYKNRRNDIHKAVSLYYKYVKGIVANTQSGITIKPMRGTGPEVSSDVVFTEPIETAPDMGTAVSSTASDSHNAFGDPVLEYLESNNIEYVDLRAKQGCLWIIGGMNIDHILNPLRIAGMVLVYKREGGTATGGREAYWTKDSSDNFTTKEKAVPPSAIQEQKTARPADEPPTKTSKTDERLRRKYPDEYKLIRKTLYELTHESDKGITLNEFQDALKLAVSYFVSHDILSNAPWSEKSGTSLYGMPMFRYIGEYSEESDDSKAASEQQDYIKESLCQTIEYLKTRYNVRLAYDHFENPTTRSNDMLYKARNDRKDIMWIYYIHTRASHYVSVETEPEYLESIGHELSGFTNIIDRYSHPCKKMIFDDYKVVKASLVEICDSIDRYFAGARISTTPSQDPEPEQKEKIALDWEKNVDLAYTTPCGFSYFNEYYPVSTWSELYVKVIAKLYEDHPHILKPNVCLAERDNGHIELGDAESVSSMRRAKQLPGTMIFIESNISATGIANRIRHVLNLCSVDADNLIVYYYGRESSGHIQAPTQIPIVDYEDPSHPGEPTDIDSRGTIKDAVVTVLRKAGEPLTLNEIMQRIVEQRLFKFNASNPTNVLYITIRRHCKGMTSRHHSPVSVFDRFTDKRGQVRYMLINEDQPQLTEPVPDAPIVSADERWLFILQDSFPDGYILDDFLCQFQAAGFWQERYGDACPIEGNSIDSAMKAIGTVRDGRVFAQSEKDKELISAICSEVDTILDYYTTVYRSCIYEHYRGQLAECQIYSEAVMTQQLLADANARFYAINQIFSRRGQTASVIQDCRKVLRQRGGAMPVAEVAKILWFIPFDTVYHNLSVDDEALNLGNSTWMLAEHFPLTANDANRIAKMLDDYFLTGSYLQAFNLPQMIQQHLPSIADNLSRMTYMAVFNIVQYYLKGRYSFSKAVISPKGTSIDFTDLFKAFGAEHETFTLPDLETFAAELNLPIYWESTYAGGAVRVSHTEFANKKLVRFDVEAIDRVLESICPGDYLPIPAVSSALMMHLPSCGYRWNGYLLHSYIYAFSKTFRLSYNSMGKNGFSGAMVRRACKTIGNYSALIERVLTDEDGWSTKEEALDLLVKQGYQTLRKYKGIDTIVEKVLKYKQSWQDRR